MDAFGSTRHQILIDRIAEYYRADERVRAVAIFGSVAAGTWHDLSDVDLDVVVADEAVVAPAEEVRALFGNRAHVVLASADSADVVLDTLEELSIRWHTLGTTSPNIVSSVRVVSGHLSEEDIHAAGEANRQPPDEQRLLDQLVRDAIGAAKAIRRSDTWTATAAVERMWGTLVSLLGRRVTLKLDPANPEAALEQVLAATRESYDLGPERERLLEQLRFSPDLLT